MSVEFNAENRNTNIRCCSFCRRPGHNITRCESDVIHNFERNTLEYIQMNTPLERFDHTNRMQLRQYLLNEALINSNLVRAFAISRCGASTRSDLSRCIDLIIQHFTPEDEDNIQEEEQTQLADSVISTSRTMQRLGFIEPEIIRGRLFLQTHNISLLHAVMFIEMIKAISETSRKFDIKTSVLENPINLEQKIECGICYEECENKNFIKLNCGHEFCKDCIKQTLQNERRFTPCCAFCRKDIKNFELKLDYIKNEFNELIEPEI